MRLTVALVLAATAAAPLAAQIKTPDRPVTDPKALVSPEDAQAKPVPIDDLGYSRGNLGAVWSADGARFYVSTNLTGRFNIWRADSDGSWPVQITQADDRQLGLTMAPDGKTLWFEQDQGGNEHYDVYRVPADGGAVVNVTNTPDLREDDLLFSADGTMLAMNTKKSSEGQTNLAVMDVASGKVRALTTETDPAWRWSPVAWVNGTTTLIAERANADSVNAEVWRVDVATGKATLLLGKTGVTYQASDATRDGRMIAVTTTEGTGQNHAAILDTATGKLRALAATPWEQTTGAISPDGKSLVVSTGVDARTEIALADLATGAMTPLALPPGTNYTVGGTPFSPDGTRLMITHAGADTPTDIYAYDIAKRTAARMTRFAMASLDPAHLPKSTIVTYKSFDGTLVSAVVTMPFNLKRDGSNPAVLIPHGGPTGQTRDGFSAWATALASRGYVVIQPNPRGSTGYGIAFQKANYQDLGGGDLKDELAAKDYIVASGYVDARKVGIAGGSYGGFMTLMAIGKAPDAFAAAVDLFGIIDWREMWKHEDALLQAYQKGLLGSPDEAPKVYDATSPLTYINQAKAPLLVMQGENDIRVPPGQSKAVIETLKAKGNIVDGVFYPGEGHGFYKRENNADSLRRMVGWFDKYLKGKAN